MDYKELIETYRSYASAWESGEQLLLGGRMRIQDTLREAADAIETLMTERDAAQKQVQDLQIQWDMYGGCEGVTATFQKAEERDAAVGELLAFRTCNTCKNSVLNRADANPCPFRIDCNGQYWEWRGPQKGEAQGGRHNRRRDRGYGGRRL